MSNIHHFKDEHRILKRNV